MALHDEAFLNRNLSPGIALPFLPLPQLAENCAYISTENVGFTIFRKGCFLP
jgi:hypothetical protein